MESFGVSFLSNLLSSMAVLIFGTFYVPRYIEWRNRPKPKLWSAEAKEEVFYFSQSSDEKWEATLHLVIQNRGKKTLERCYWEMFIKNGPAIEFAPSSTHKFSVKEVEHDGIKYKRYYGYLNDPIFSLESVDFPFEIKIKNPSREKVEIRYFFKTDYGQYPFWSWIAVFYGKFSLLKKITIE